jgi:hypothetical protein
MIPWVAIPFTPLLGLPESQLGAVIAALVIGAEIIGAIAVAVLGKEAYDRIVIRFRHPKNKAHGTTPLSTGPPISREMSNE